MEPYVKLVSNIFTFLGLGSWSIPGSHVYAKFTGELTSNFNFTASTVFFVLGIFLHFVAWYTLFWDCKRIKRT